MILILHTTLPLECRRFQGASCRLAYGFQHHIPLPNGYTRSRPPGSSGLLHARRRQVRAGYGAEEAGKGPPPSSCFLALRFSCRGAVCIQCGSPRPCPANCARLPPHRCLPAADSICRSASQCHRLGASRAIGTAVWHVRAPMGGLAPDPIGLGGAVELGLLDEFLTVREDGAPLRRRRPRPLLRRFRRDASALEQLLENVLRLLWSCDPEGRRGAAGCVVVADTRGELVAHVHALRRAQPHTALQRRDANGLVAQVAPHVSSTIEAARGEGHLRLGHRGLQAERGLV
mmetsp:Transcript_15924/g.41035  ORF Transcript_15924/g.41035 Transcript_15924/m.41035 type:complete len:288 (+) Transcript_15924:56-919(+)